MQTILNYLKSDTIKAIMAAFVLNGFAAIFPDILPTSALTLANEILLGLASYFRIKIKTQL